MRNVETSRRSFLKLGAIAGIGAIGSTALSACAPKGTEGTKDSKSTSTATSDISWDGQFDVVVVGFGAAGAASALSAASAGAQVLLIDKAPEGHEGGNSRFCAQLFVSIADKEEGLTHYKAQRGNFDTSDDIIETYVDGMMKIKDTLASWGLDPQRIVDYTDKGASNLTVEYPELPGAKAVRTNFVDGYKTQALWRFLKQTVVDRKDKIDCWYESPATRLIQDPATGSIIGVQIKREGKSVNIAAKNGVVMALGGFENNPFYQKTFLGHTKMYPHGTLYNEGDGISMTQSVGAKLWHMTSYESMGLSLATEADRVRLVSPTPFFGVGSVILVGGDGRRYIAEDLEQRHGHRKIGGTWMIPSRPERNIFVWDAYHTQNVKSPYLNWSSDLSKEIASGKIVQAASLNELAGKFEIDPTALQTTVDQFNKCSEIGFDAMGREAENLRAFGDGPYYGIEVWPTILNTQGGPERTTKAEIVNASDKPIGHLYSAGEFGGVNANLYQGGSNIAECLVFGKIAGENAAAPKDDALDIGENNSLIPGCGDLSILDQNPDDSGLTPEQAVGSALGIGGPIWVKVTTANSKITAIETLHQTESEGIGTIVFDADQISAAVISSGTIEGVDVISGATVSSNGFLNAIKNAQEKI